MSALEGDDGTVGIVAPAAPEGLWRKLRSIVGGSTGNLVEFFDWHAYSAFALYFSKIFFPPGDRTVQLIGAASIFAIGFIARPAGSWIMGIYGDRAGRRAGLVLSMGIMGLGSLTIGLLPGYASIGIFSPILLLVARVIQGLSIGGQYGISATYLSEVSTAKYRGFWTSFHFVTQMLGLFIGMTILLILQRTMDPADLAAWGWRIPFFIGAGLSLGAVLMMSRLDETKAYQAVKRRGAKINAWKAIVKYPREFLVIMALTMAGTIAIQNYNTYMQKFLVNTSGYTVAEAAQVVTAALIVFTAVHPLAGWLSDIYGRRKVLIWYMAIATLDTVPIMSALSEKHSFTVTFLLLIAGSVPLSLYSAPSALFKAELFPAEIRALGVGLSFAIPVAIFGGTAELIALSLKKAGYESWYYWYMTAAMGIGWITAVLMREPKDASLIDKDG